jgi:hypothetical protein
VLKIPRIDKTSLSTWSRQGEAKPTQFFGVRGYSYLTPTGLKKCVTSVYKIFFMKEIIFYKTDLGKCPVEDFLNSLTGKQAVCVCVC